MPGKVGRRSAGNSLCAITETADPELYHRGGSLQRSQVRTGSGAGLLPPARLRMSFRGSGRHSGRGCGRGRNAADNTGGNIEPDPVSTYDA